MINRLELLKLERIRGIAERDMLSSNFSTGMQLTRPYTTHLVKRDEVGRPDLIAHRAYKIAGLWWFILKVNGIIDPFAIQPNKLLLIPSLLDFYDYYGRYKKG